MGAPVLFFEERDLTLLEGSPAGESRQDALRGSDKLALPLAAGYDRAVRTCSKSPRNRSVSQGAPPNRARA
jgi:hypothetical protein